MNNILSVIISFVLISTLASCGKELFNPIRKRSVDSTPPIKTHNTHLCALHTTVRPPVDILFLWDNSSGTKFMSHEVKKSLSTIIDNISSRFDYHIVLAPLQIPTGAHYNHKLKIITRTTDGLNNEALGYRTNPSQYSMAIDFDTGSGNEESGLLRLSELLKNNQANGIFRKNAYHLMVLMSNEDDKTHGNNVTAMQTYLENHVHELLCMRGSYTPPYGKSCGGFPILNSKMMRLISIVPQPVNNSCPGIDYYRNYGVYERASHDIFQKAYVGSSFTNSAGIDADSYPVIQRSVNGNVGFTAYDTVNMCQGLPNYKAPKNVFDTVNNVIQDVVIHHVYRYWPVAGHGIPINEFTISVKGSDDTYYSEIPSNINITRDLTGKNDKDQYGNKVTGWRYVGDITRDTRFLPTNGEPFTGHLIELFGDAKPTHPSCLFVSSNAPTEYYGYVYVAPTKPLLSSIELRINGVLIPQSSSNGWTLEPNHSTGRNIRIVGPSDPTPAYPAINKPAGYYLKVHGSAIYSNSASLDVKWLPTSN